MTNHKSNEKKNDYPGYPHYPAKEDIMNSKENERVNVDVENLSRSKNIPSSTLPDKSVKSPMPNDKPPLADVDADDPDSDTITDADITPDDLVALGADQVDYGEKELLSGEDLDVPGAEADDENEEIGEEDEENNYYSLGGEAHEDLEEDRS
jgi:hypothetical protein